MYFPHLKFISEIIFRLQRFEKTNEMLSNCNSLSATRLERALRDFRGHTQHINGLKKELDQVFKRIRVIKSRLTQQYPEAFSKSKYCICNEVSCSYIIYRFCLYGTCTLNLKY